MHPVDFAIIAASATTALGGLLYVGRAFLNLVRKQDQQNELLFGDGTPEHPGLQEWQRRTTSAIDEATRLARVAAKEAGMVANRIVQIEKEFKPNSGTSIRDQLNRIEKALTSEESR